MNSKITLIVFLAILSVACRLFAATPITVSVKPSGGDYTTLADALDSNRQNLVSNDKRLEIVISDYWVNVDTKPVLIYGYDCDSSHDIIIRTTGEARHNGTAASGYRLSPSISADNIKIEDNNKNIYITFDGLVVLGSTYSGNSGIEVKYIGPSNLVTIKNCIVDGRGYSNIGILTSDADTRANVYNNIVIGCKYGGYGGIRLGGNTLNAYNNTVSSCTYGIYAVNTVLAVNNACFRNNTDFYGTANFSTSSRNNLSSDGTADDNNLSNSV